MPARPGAVLLKIGEAPARQLTMLIALNIHLWRLN
jgi:hypothetical protein